MVALFSERSSGNANLSPSLATAPNTRARSSVLDRLELALVRFAIGRRAKTGAEALVPALVAGSEDRALVFTAVAKLGEKLVLPLGLSENGATNTAGEYHPATTPGES